VKETEPTDAQSVAADKAALTWDAIKGMNTAQDNVTVDLAVLPTEGAYGSMIIWYSYDNAISDAGVVTRPAYGTGDATFMFGATIGKGTEYDEVIFTLTVKEAENPDLIAVNADKAALIWDSFKGANDSMDDVTADLGNLLSAGANGSSIVWSSDNTSVVSITGTVTRPVYGEGDATVILTATISKGTASDTAIFTLNVKELPQSDAQAVAADKAALKWSDIEGSNAAQTNVTVNLALLSTGACGTTIVWYSNDTSIISNDGIVTRPAYGNGDAFVTITAVISKGTETGSKEFQLTVKELPPVVHNVSVTGGTADPASGVAGTIVTLTADAVSAGKQFRAWIVVSGNVTITNNTFTIGSANVVIKAEWEYGITVGATETWKKDAANGHTITVYGNLEDHTDVKVNGVSLTKNDHYTATSGSTIITLSKDYLTGLSNGVHNIEIIFNDGSVLTTLTISDADTTGDPEGSSDGSSITGILIICIIVLAAAGFCVYWFLIRK
jgi:hypothetical protein